MDTLVYVWFILKEAGQVAPIVGLGILVVIWRNDLRHLQQDLRELKEAFYHHLEWHCK